MCGELCVPNAPKSLTQVILKMVEETPNDQELGKKIRELITDIYDVPEVPYRPLGEEKVKQIVDTIYGDV